MYKCVAPVIRLLEGKSRRTEHRIPEFWDIRGNDLGNDRLGREIAQFPYSAINPASYNIYMQNIPSERMAV
jgi:hypothetical protein